MEVQCDVDDCEGDLFSGFLFKDLICFILGSGCGFRNLGCSARVSRTKLVESGRELTNCSHSPVPRDLRSLRAILGASTGPYLALGFYG